MSKFGGKGVRGYERITYGYKLDGLKLMGSAVINCFSFCSLV